jgi:soluble lytic murein transglycosylase-like protein
VVQAESAYNSKAVSTAGAMGLMQLMPATAERYGVADVWDPRQNLNGGARYLRDLLDMFKNNLKLALAAYNAGESAVMKYGNRIPPYPETQNYVRKVIDFYLIERRKKKS